MLRLDLNIVWTIINLLIIYFLMKKFLFRPVHKILDARQEEIDKEYAQIKSARDAAEAMQKELDAAISGIAGEKAAALNEARSQGIEEYDRIVAQAQAQARKLLADAEFAANIEQEKRMQQAREQITDLVLAATAKIVGVKAGAEADRALYDQFIVKTGEKSETSFHSS